MISSNLYRERNMRTSIAFFMAVSLAFLLAGDAGAGTKLRVEKDAISVSSPGPGGMVAVWGSPGSVYGAHPIHVTVINKDRKIAREGIVLRDGSFSVSLPGYGDEDIKVKFTAANGKKKSVGLEVPKYTVMPPAVVVPGTVTETVVYPGTVIEKKTVTEDVEVIQ